MYDPDLDQPLALQRAQATQLLSSTVQPHPDLTPAIGAWLRSMYPLRPPTVGASMAEIQRDAGHQDVVAFVLQAIESLEET
jgi:hypothetical protein